MVIYRSQNKITDFFMILAWASLFNVINTIMCILSRNRRKNDAYISFNLVYIITICSLSTLTDIIRGGSLLELAYVITGISFFKLAQIIAGGSLFKLAYVIADEDSDTGHLHLATFQISETDDVIRRLKQLFSARIQSGDVMLSTGFAAQEMKSQISEILGIR